MPWSQQQAPQTADWVPPRQPACSCPEHVDDLTNLVVPVTDDGRLQTTYDAMTVEDLVDSGALSAKPTKADGRWLDTFDPQDGTFKQRIGPFHWALWIGDAARLCYDDDAAFSLDQALLASPGVQRVEWMDTEAFLIGAPTLCASGMMAAAARALADPRVRQR